MPRRPGDYKKKLKMKLCTQCPNKARKNQTTCKDCAERVRARTADKKRRGLCVRCDEKAVEGLFVCKNHRNKDAHRHSKKKIAILTHYGKEGRLMCCWKDCCVIDPDMLSLDHINDDGADQKRRHGNDVYGYVIRKNFPNGFQTLCFNHQWKKRISRLRRNR